MMAKMEVPTGEPSLGANLAWAERRCENGEMVTDLPSLIGGTAARSGARATMVVFDEYNECQDKYFERIGLNLFNLFVAETLVCLEGERILLPIVYG